MIEAFKNDGRCKIKERQGKNDYFVQCGNGLSITPGSMATAGGQCDHCLVAMRNPQIAQELSPNFKMAK